MNDYKTVDVLFLFTATNDGLIDGIAGWLVDLFEAAYRIATCRVLFSPNQVIPWWFDSTSFLDPPKPCFLIVEI